MQCSVPSVFLLNVLVIFSCFVPILMRAELCKLCWLSYKKNVQSFSNTYDTTYKLASHSGTFSWFMCYFICMHVFDSHVKFDIRTC